MESRGDSPPPPALKRLPPGRGQERHFNAKTRRREGAKKLNRRKVRKLRGKGFAKNGHTF